MNAAPTVLCDAGPLIHLDELDAISLLTDFPQVVVPPMVWKEVTRHRPDALTAGTISFSKAAAPGALSVELETLSRLLALHSGELEALQLADDSAARLAAGNLGTPTHGTIGILVCAIRRKQKPKSEVLMLLRSLPAASTLHIRSALLDDIIQKVEQSP